MQYSVLSPAEPRHAGRQEAAGGGDDGGQSGLESHHGPPATAGLGTLHPGEERHEVRHWSSSDFTALSLVESFIVMKYFQSDASP